MIYRLQMCYLTTKLTVSVNLFTGGGHGGDREVTINVKRGVEAKNYGDVSIQT